MLVNAPQRAHLWRTWISTRQAAAWSYRPLSSEIIRGGGPIAGHGLLQAGRWGLSLYVEMHAQVVEVLPAAEYEDEHVAGAISIPLKELDEQAPRLLEHGRPVIL
jgi:hypothetical protein